jgi:leucyl aminopeptidase
MAGAAAAQGQLRVVVELELPIQVVARVVQGVLHTLHPQVLRVGQVLS